MEATTEGSPKVKPVIGAGASPYGRGPELDAEPKRIPAMLKEGRVDDARALVKRLELAELHSDQLDHYVRALEPPRVVPGAGHAARRRDEEHAWLDANASRYPGCWIAVLDDCLIAADPDRKAVMDAIRMRDSHDFPLLWYQTSDAECD